MISMSLKNNSNLAALVYSAGVKTEVTFIREGKVVATFDPYPAPPEIKKLAEESVPANEPSS